MENSLNKTNVDGKTEQTKIIDKDENDQDEDENNPLISPTVDEKEISERKSLQANEIREGEINEALHNLSERTTHNDLKESEGSVESQESTKNEAFIQESDTSWTNDNTESNGNKISTENVEKAASEITKTKDISKNENLSKEVKKLYEATNVESEDDINANQFQQLIEKRELIKEDNITTRVTKSLECKPTTSSPPESETCISENENTREQKSHNVNPTVTDPDKKTEYHLVEFHGLRENPNLTCAVAVDIMPASVITSAIPIIPEIQKEEIKPIEISVSIPEPIPETTISKIPEPTVSRPPKPIKIKTKDQVDVIAEEEEVEVEEEGHIPIWMPKPKQIPLNCPPGLEILAELHKISIYQTTYFEGWATSTNFMIKNQFGQNVYRVNAHMPSCAFSFACATCKKYELSFLDAKGVEVMHFTRQAARKGRRCIDIYAPCGVLIGKVLEERIDEPLFFVLDKANEVQCRIEMKNRQPTRNNYSFDILSVSGNNVIGKIELESGSLSKAFKHSNFYSLQYFTQLDAKIKASILGASFLIDFIYFEIF